MLSELLIKNYNAELVHTESTGVQISKMFLLQGPGAQSGAMFMLTYLKPETEKNSGSLGFITAKAVMEHMGR